tara:strand:+ start:68 stop:943 length:876 start_codon:yes stop_codon:yes gene_type:complete
MDPFTIALATFGIQKLRGKSTRTALKDAALVGGTTYGFNQLTASLGAQAGAGAGAGAGTGIAAQQSGQATAAAPLKKKSFLQKLLGERATKDAAGNIIKEGSGFRGLGTGEKLFLGTTALSLIPEDEVPFEPPFSEEDYKQAKIREAAKLKGGFEPAPTYTGGIQSFAPASIYAAKGGLAEIKKFNEGGINYLPSKSTHDENDVHNYVRAQGYVEDGAGNGDKDEDTMLAQLADGEFVSRADAVLGAGILSGASPKDRKDMRSKGASFFYDQQKKFKRIFDLVDAKREKTN